MHSTAVSLQLLRRSLKCPSGATVWPGQLVAARRFGSHSTRCQGTSAAVPVPLCQRQADNIDELDVLLSWRRDALDTIRRIGDSLQQLDGGPSQQELQTELRWLTEDVLEAVRFDPAGPWQPVGSWQQLEAELVAEQRRHATATSPASSVGSSTLQTWQAKMRLSMQELQQLWHRRVQERVPYQYLAATAHWRDLVLSVGPGVLIPRPETEQMVDWAAEAIAAAPHLAAAPWLDLGTGSGALAVGVARLLQGGPEAAHVYAVDLSPVAAAYASYNASACGVGERMSVLQGSWYDPVQHLAGAVGGIVSNPPYIPKRQMSGLQAEVGQHEPTLALDGGEGPGLDSLEVICQGAVGMLVQGGFMILETAGGEQALQVQSLLQQARDQQGRPAFQDVKVRDDYYSVQRFVSATRN